ncbi:MAG: iron-containing alcohol dehydrogenase [Pseudomonadota bacterium]
MSLILYLTRIHFADGVLEDALGEEAKRHAIARPLILTENSPAAAPWLDRVIDALPGKAPPTLVSADPQGPAAADRQRVQTALNEGACDGIVALGERRTLDLSRVFAAADVPVIALPTTTETIGLGPIAPHIWSRPARRPPVPSAILCDPTLTTGLDPAATAAAGMGVLVQCLESFLSTTFNPPADGIALDGLRRAAGSLERSVADGADLDARRDLLAAALNAGLAAEKGFGGIEAAAHGLEAASHRRAGRFRGALLAKVLAFNAPAIEDRFAAIRATLGLPPRADIAAHLSALAERIGLPLSLSEAGIAAPVLPDAAARAAADPANRTNPRHAIATDYESILRATL